MTFSGTESCSIPRSLTCGEISQSSHTARDKPGSEQKEPQKLDCFSSTAVPALLLFAASVFPGKGAPALWLRVSGNASSFPLWGCRAVGERSREMPCGARGARDNPSSWEWAPHGHLEEFRGEKDLHASQRVPVFYNAWERGNMAYK